ncbi:MAG: hypothetical protein QOJ79_3490 [Actinomycetota bacterium]|jgi:hypothetical protein|nr:hypothetical protein [Actinomycetota bacterium]
MALFGKKGQPGAVPTKPDPANPLAPPVDLSVPVTNPELLAALTDPEQDTKRLLQALVRATFLMAVQYTHPDGRPAIEDGMMRVGSRITILSVRDEADNDLLALFTDADALHASVGPTGWGGQVIQAVEALELAAAQHGGRAVINPDGPVATWRLEPDQVAHLLAVVRPT